MTNSSRLLSAARRARHELLSVRAPGGPWTDERTASVASTAAAISACAVYLGKRQPRATISGGTRQHDFQDLRLDGLLRSGLQWLVDQQHKDGGWTDSPEGPSDLATTLLVRSTFALMGVPARAALLVERADAFLKRSGGWTEIRQRGRDEVLGTSAILMTGAAAGLCAWQMVPRLAGRETVRPDWLAQLVRPSPSPMARPLALAINLARDRHCPPRTPLGRSLRKRSQLRAWHDLAEIRSGRMGYLESIPLSSFLVISLVSGGESDHPAATAAFQYLIASAQSDGTWPLASLGAVRQTASAILALDTEALPIDTRGSLARWLLARQQLELHPLTLAGRGGWSRSGEGEAPPTATDTARVILALARLQAQPLDVALRGEIGQSCRLAGSGLVSSQLIDGGWSPFLEPARPAKPRSRVEATAEVLRGLDCLQRMIPSPAFVQSIERGRRYLESAQLPDGTWPSPSDPESLLGPSSRILETAVALRALGQVGGTGGDHLQRARDALLNSQNLDGGWGGGWQQVEPGEEKIRSGLVETALALESLHPWREMPRVTKGYQQGLAWLCQEIETGRYPWSPALAFDVGRLWYDERLASAIPAAITLRVAVDDLTHHASDPSLVAPATP